MADPRAVRARTVARLALACGLVSACSRVDPATKSDPPAPATSAAQAASASAAAPHGPLVLARSLKLEEASPGDDVPAIVANARARAARDGRDLVVYVGATWCEPCRRFHDAADRGELDSVFPDLTILTFDIDQDRERLFAAGYKSRLIPLFVVPDEQGRPTSKRVEGAPKGDRAVSTIAPQLQAILAR